jgi:Fe2+ transport system protein FeoA
MGTNPCGRGTKTIGVNMPIAEVNEIKRRADSMGISMGAYIKIILRQWTSSGKKIVLKEK